MSFKKGTIVFQGDAGSPHTGQRGKTTISEVIDLAATQTLATALDPYTSANIGTSTLHTSDGVIADKPNTGANIDRKGVVVMQEVGTGKVSKIVIPAFSESGTDVEMVEGGERITLATRNAIASACTTATGKTLKAVDGYIVQPK